MTNVPPGGGFPPPPSGPPPGGFPPPPGGGFPPPPGGGGYPPPPGGGYGPPPGGGFQGATGAPVEWQDRLISGLIDYVGPFLLATVVGSILNTIVSSSTNIYFSPFGLIFGLLALGWALYNGYIAGQTGQSFGMKQSGLRLVGEHTGQPIGGSSGLVRNLLFLAYAICGCFGIVVVLDALWPLWDSNKQTLRDKIAKSVVIKA